MERKQYVRLSDEQRKEVLQMYKDGLNQFDLADLFGVTQRTVSNIVKEESIKADGFAFDRTHKGSARAKSIDVSPVPVKPLRKAPAVSEKPQKPKIIENQQNVSSVVTERRITVTGLGTKIKYTVSSNEDFVLFENEGQSFKVELDKLVDMILELEGVKKNAANLKVGCEAW